MIRTLLAEPSRTAALVAMLGTILLLPQSALPADLEPEPPAQHGDANDAESEHRTLLYAFELERAEKRALRAGIAAFIGLCGIGGGFAMVAGRDDLEGDLGGVMIATIGTVVFVGGLGGVARASAQRSRILELRGAATAGGGRVGFVFHF